MLLIWQGKPALCGWSRQFVTIVTHAAARKGKINHFCTHGVKGEEENTIRFKFVSGYDNHQHLIREEGL